MIKKVNKWMVSTIVVTLVSIVIIGLLTYKLSAQPQGGGKQDFLEMPENGQRPNQQGENGEPPGKVNEETDGETSDTESSSNGANI